jgi:3',5'-cyclic AMP phosphodiesterase CpdA
MRIAIVSDSHLAPRAEACERNWHAVAAAVRALEPDFTVHLGDVTLDGVRHREDLTHAAALLEAWPGVIEVVPGNHDMGDASGERPLDHAALGRCIDALGGDHWHVHAGAWHLFGINAQLLGSATTAEAEQWAWLEAIAMGLPAGARSVLFLHRPLLRPGSDANQRGGRYVAPAAAQRLLAGPLGASLEMVLSGHTHQALEWSAGGQRHVWVPSCSFVFNDDLQARVGAKLVGIGLLTLDTAARYQLLCLPELRTIEAVALKPLLELRDLADRPLALPMTA